MKNSKKRTNAPVSDQERATRRRIMWREIGKHVDPWDVEYWRRRRAACPPPQRPSHDDFVPYRPTDFEILFMTAIELVEAAWGIDGFPRGLASTERLVHAVDGEWARASGHLPLFREIPKGKKNATDPDAFMKADLDVYEKFLEKGDFDVDYAEEIADLVVDLDQGRDAHYPLPGDRPKTRRERIREKSLNSVFG